MKKINPSLMLICIAGISLMLTSCPGQKQCDLVFLDFPDSLKKNIRPGELDSIRMGLIKFGPKNEYLKKFVARDSLIKLYDNGYLLLSLFLNPNAITVGSKQELMDSLLSISKKNNCCIRRITIIGHASPGSICVGGGQRPRFCKYINGDSANRAQFTRIFAPLKTILCKSGAELILYGCNVGKGPKGMNKLQELADSFNITVTGATDFTIAAENIDQLDEDQKATAKPGGKQKTIRPGETDSLNRSDAQRLIRDMLPARNQSTFLQNVVGLGVYPANLENIESLIKNSPAPVKDRQLINEFANCIDTSRCKTTFGFNSHSSAVVILWHANGTFSIGHAILGNHLFTVSDADENTLIFSVKDPGPAIIKKLLEKTISLQ